MFDEITHAYGYVRLSGLAQVNGGGNDRQEETIRTFAARHGIHLHKLFFEVYTGKDEDRPEFMNLLEAMMRNGCKVVVIECLDRFARDAGVQTVLLAKLCAEGITLLSALTSENITANWHADPYRRAMIQMQGVFAELERRLVVRRLTAGLERKKRLTGRAQGALPYGEHPDHPKEKTILHLIADHWQTTHSVQQIADLLNSRGLRKRRGTLWTAADVRHLVYRLDPNARKPRKQHETTETKST